MNAGMLGAWLGSFMIAGLLPAVFILYGRSNKKAWATVIGAGLGGLFLLGTIVGGGFNLGTIAAILLLAFAFAKKYPTPPV